ncbi:extracellular solute-binding protein [Bifidobacterium sp. ESL0704]|uniref:ABC transporter substrate-binding protein n=1 Tax=Bifidobacterium sp. ESL0704 TaxID=2983219 RepID=UPI0023F8D172|nr:extracellular solute-binding protein [Bifidobacterium sp. ESL0704]WEV53280.1 extracellular solute-binding protein [Bifidobacterium sp. ESL0704]
MKFSKSIIAAVASVAMLASLGACGSGSQSSSSSSKKDGASISMNDVNAALKSDKDVKLNFWTWRDDIEGPSIAAFEAKYPHIKINVVKTGAAADHYTKFQNVLKSKKDIPDIVQLEYDYLPQYAVSGSLLNFSSPSIESSMGKLYNDASWRNVHVADGLYGVPLDQGPEAFFWRHDVLDQYGIQIPKTWKEFEESGIKLHKANPNKYMGFIDTTDVRYMASIIRQSGAIPWQVDGVQNVKLSMTDAKVKEAVNFIQRLIDEDVLEPVANKSDEYNRGFAEGRWAVQFDGCWKGTSFTQQQPSLKGKMEVALPPAWGDDASNLKTGEVGGSLISVTSATAQEKRAAAIAFCNWMSSSKESINEFQKTGSFFNAAKSFQEDPKQASVKNDYFGGQQVNKVYFESAKKLSSGWTVLPFNSQYATSFKDIVVPALKKNGNLFGKFAPWQANLKQYAEDQGFKITESK